MTDPSTYSNDFWEALGKRVKETRTKRGLGMIALAKASGLSTSKISRIENAEGTTTILQGLQLCKGLHVDYHWLVTGAHRAWTPK